MRKNGNKKRKDETATLRFAISSFQLFNPKDSLTSSLGRASSLLECDCQPSEFL